MYWKFQFVISFLSFIFSCSKWKATNGCTCLNAFWLNFAKMMTIYDFVYYCYNISEVTRDIENCSFTTGTKQCTTDALQNK